MTATALAEGRPLSRLKELLQTEGFFDHREKRLLIFTEFKDTLDYLVGCLKKWGFLVGVIHGGMKPGSRDEPNTRLHTLDDDAVFNVVGEVLPAAHIERVLRDYYAGRLGDADLEDRLLRDVDATRFLAICQNALEGLASKKLNLEMLIERRALAQERRVVPETIARFIRDSSELVSLSLKPVAGLLHTFEPGKTPAVLRSYEGQPDWRLPALATRYPRFSTDRETSEDNNLEWVTPGHSLFESLRRHSLMLAQDTLGKGACFCSLQHETPHANGFL